MRVFSPLLFALVFVISCAHPALAETAYLTLQGDRISIPVPGSFKNVSEDSNMPDRALLLETRVVEQWEKAGEFSDGMLVVGWSYASPDAAVQQVRFDAMADAIGRGLQAKSKRKTYDPSSPDVAVPVYKDILAMLGRGGVGNVRVVENTPLKKSYVFDSAFEMPGVITFPLVEDVSLVRVKGKLIVFQTWRLAHKPSVRAQMLRVSQRLRNAILRANPS